MSYTKLTDFASKDALLTGNPSKLVRGTELGAEFDAIAVADALNIKPDTVTAATGKTTPVDTDLLTLFDSASTFSLKKLTWANIKATLKTYFDTLYVGAGANSTITSLTGLTSISGQGNTLLINSATTSKPQVRQTVLSGPVDSSGIPSFGGGTGSTTVTASGTLIATAANGYAAGGGIDYIGSITNPSWTSLSTNGTMYLYLDIAAAGTCTTGSTTLAPTYRWGGADVVTNNQFTFNIQEMVGKVGNGSVATQTYRVFVGEVTVSGSVVTAITWYALQGRYQQAWVSTLPAAGVAVSANHNIGTVELTTKLEVQNITAEFGFVAGDIVTEVNGNTGGVAASPSICRTAKTIGFTTTNTAAIHVLNKTTGANALLTLANWKYRLIAQRSW